MATSNKSNDSPLSVEASHAQGDTMLKLANLLIVLGLIATPSMASHLPQTTFGINISAPQRLSQTPTTPSKTSTIIVTGVIEFVDVEGGCYRMKTQDGRSFELLGTFPRKAGLRVQVRGKLVQDMATFCQVGQLLQVESIKVLQSEIQQLADTKWVLKDLGGTAVINSPQTPTLRFNGPERIEGQGGCNSYSAQSQIKGDRLTVDPIIATKRACVDPQAQEQEIRYFCALEGAQRFSLEGQDLLIYSERYDKPLRFSRFISRGMSPSAWA